MPEVESLLVRLRTDETRFTTSRARREAERLGAVADRVAARIGAISEQDANVRITETGAAETERRVGSVGDAVRRVDNSEASVRVGETGALRTRSALDEVDDTADRIDGRNVSLAVGGAAGATALGAGMVAASEKADLLQSTLDGLSAHSMPLAITRFAGVAGAATSAASAAGALAVELGKGAAGLVAIGGVAGGAAYAGLKGYVALLSSTATASREAYFAMNEGAQEALDLQRNQMLATEASAAFNEELNDSVIGFAKLQAAVGEKAFPAFTRELDYWNENMAVFTPEIASAAGEIANIAAGFSEFVRNADEGRVLADVVTFISDSAVKAATGVSYLGATGLEVFHALIGPAERLQDGALGVASAVYRWSQSAEGARTLRDVVSQLETRMHDVLGIAGDVGRGILNIFSALEESGAGDALLGDVKELAQGFSGVAREGSESRDTLIRWANEGVPVLRAAGGVAAELWRQFARVADAAMDVRLEGSKTSALVGILDTVRDALGPVADTFIDTFEVLGPKLPGLIENLSGLFTTFAGQSPVLAVYLDTLNTVLSTFNDLPGPVKDFVANAAVIGAMTSTGPGGGVLGFAGALGQVYFQFKILQALGATTIFGTIAGKVSAAAGAVWGFVAAQAAAVGGFAPLMAGVAAAAAIGAIVIDIVVHAPDIAKSFATKYEQARKSGQGIGQSFLEGMGASLDSTWIGGMIGRKIDAAQQWLKDSGIAAKVSLWDVIMGRAEAKENPILKRVVPAYNATREWVVGLKPPVSLWDVITGKKSAQQHPFLSRVTAAYNAAREWVAGLRPQTSLWDVITGRKSAAQHPLLARVQAAYASARDWVAQLRPETSLWDVLTGRKTASEHPFLKWIQDTYAGAKDWVSQLRPETSLWDVITGRKSASEHQLLVKVEGAYDRARGFVEGLKPQTSLWDVITGKADASEHPFLNKLQDTYDKAREKLDAWAEGVSERWDTFWTNMGDRFQRWRDWALDSLGSWGDRAKETFFSWTDGVKSRWDEFWTGMGDRFERWRDWALSAVSGLREGFVSRISDLADGASERWDSFWTSMGDRWERWRDWALSSISTWGDSAKDRFSSFGDGTKSWWDGLWTGMGDRWERWRDWAVSSMGSWADNASDKFSSFGDGLRSRWDEHWTSMGDRWERWRDWLRDDSGSFLDNLRDLFGDKFGNIADTMGEHILDGINKVRSFLGDLMGAVARVLGVIGMDDVAGQAMSAHDKLKTPIQMARGGLVSGDAGALGDGSRIVAITNEAGPEAVIPLRRKTPEGMRAYRAAEAKYGPGRSREEHARRYRHRGDNPKYFADGGLWTPGVQGVVDDVTSKFPTSATTYGGHGRHGDSTTSVDFSVPSGYGVDATGSSKGVGDSIARHLESNWDAFSTEYLIWYRNMKESRDGPWFEYVGGGGYDPPFDPTTYHTDHVHYSSTPSWGGPESLTGTGGGAPVVQTLSALGQKVLDWMKERFKDSLPGLPSTGMGLLGEGLVGFAANTVGNAADWLFGHVRDWLMPKYGTYGSSGGSAGSAELRRWITEGLNKDKLFPATDENVSGYARLAMQESSGDPNIVQNIEDINSKMGGYGGFDDNLARGLLQNTPQSWEGNRGYMGLPDPGLANPNIFDPVKSVLMRARNQHRMLGGISFTAGYGLGGQIPGPEGKPVLIQAHSGEGVVPRRGWDAMDRLATSLVVWSAGSASRSPGRGPAVVERGFAGGRGQKGVEDRLERIEAVLERQHEDMLDAREVLEGALDVQDSPAGRKRHKKRNEREYDRALSRMGG